MARAHRQEGPHIPRSHAKKGRYVPHPNAVFDLADRIGMSMQRSIGLPEPGATPHNREILKEALKGAHPETRRKYLAEFDALAR